jgi:hypothetical protein
MATDMSGRYLVIAPGSTAGARKAVHIQAHGRRLHNYHDLSIRNGRLARTYAGNTHKGS